MDIDLIHKVANEHKILSEKIFRARLESEDKIALRNIYSDYIEKILISNFENILKKYESEYMATTINHKIWPHFKEIDAFYYRNLFIETKKSVSKLMYYSIRKDAPITNNISNSLGILDLWMYWSGMDDNSFKIKFKERIKNCDEEIRYIGIINSSGKKIVNHWFKYRLNPDNFLDKM